MGNNDYSSEEIKELVEAGWNFRIKKVKGKNYITRRKGQTEKSMGPYNEKLWTNIREIVKKKPKLSEKSVTSLSKFEILFKKWDEQLGTIRGFNAMNTCLFLDKERFCSYYGYNRKPGFMLTGEKMTDIDFIKLKEFNQNGVKKHLWIHKANIEYCKNCHAYISKKMKEKITE
ncbi:hypothetical protein ACFL0D_03910 [Thermoproteota archaeon]